MSGTTNEPGGTQPSGDATEPVAAQAAEQRSDAGVGGEVYHEGGDGTAAAPGENTQDEPVLAQNDASTQDKLDGIAAQTRVDLGDESHDRYQEVLRQRLNDSDIQLTDDEVSDLARRSSGGNSAGGSGV